LGLYGNDVDDVIERAEGSGATIREPLSTFDSGDRFCSIRDRSVSDGLSDPSRGLSDEEITRRLADWANEQTSHS
jgi:PhnB protein